VRAADANLRLELDNALDQIAPDAEEVTWEQAEVAIQKSHQGEEEKRNWHRT
jgi:hypothetical protein